VTDLFEKKYKRPWDVLKAMRKRLSISQLELSQGIITQATLSQIEAGRTLPSKAVLHKLYQRLRVDPEPLYAEWDIFRHRHMLRESLWNAFLVNQDDVIQKELQSERALILTSMECQMYETYLLAQYQQWEQVENKLWKMGRKVSSQRPAAHRELRKIDRCRVSAVEAKVYMLVAEGLNRQSAAAYWRHTLSQRIDEGNWKSSTAPPSLPMV
jgi:transcriptional regulator with XRE-family HTH domain